MAVPRNTSYVNGDQLQALMMNRIQEMLAPLSVNLELSVSGTTVQLTCGAGDTACIVMINGKMRYAEASKTVSLAAQPDGTYGIWVTTGADDNDPSFTLTFSSGTPAGTNIRQVGSVVKTGSTLVLTQIVGYEKHGFMHRTGADPLPAASIGETELSSSVNSKLLPVGAVILHAGALPSGFAELNGGTLSRTTESALFGVIGTTFGVGDGSTTFTLPDMRGRVPVGLGTGVGLTARSMGQSGGAETHVLTEAQMPSHAHGGFTEMDGAHQHNYLYPNDGISVFQAGTNRSGALISGTTTTTVLNSTSNHEHAIPVSGSDQSHPNMQPWLALRYIIKK